MQVRALDLLPGDELVYADLVDRVVAVSDLGGCVVRVDVVRNGRPTHWFAGKQSRQEVVSR